MLSLDWVTMVVSQTSSTWRLRNTDEGRRGHPLYHPATNGKVWSNKESMMASLYCVIYNGPFVSESWVLGLATLDFIFIPWPQPGLSLTSFGYQSWHSLFLRHGGVLARYHCYTVMRAWVSMRILVLNNSCVLMILSCHFQTCPLSLICTLPLGTRY